LDFDLKKKKECVSGNLCKINIKEDLNEGYENLGMVFNLDDHDESGSHWVSMYVELVPRNRGKASIYYFDSTADKPTKEIKKLVDNITKQYEKLKNDKIEFLYNDISHQKKNTECGVYCIHFITTMLEGKNFKEYINEIKRDDFMQKFRSFYFIEE